jgi:glutamyl-tRNA reductase
MGQPMARHLLKHGFVLTVWNRTRSKAEELVPLGARVAASVADASRADIVITMLAYGDLIVSGRYRPAGFKVTLALKESASSSTQLGPRWSRCRSAV